MPRSAVAHSFSPRLSAESSALDIRHAARQGHFRGHTSGLAQSYVQGNVVLVPASHADSFRTYCERNVRACPILAISEPGDPSLPALGHDLDIRTDVPRYRVWHAGISVAEPFDIWDFWRRDFVTFVIGCSFTFEHVLVEAGIRLRHVAEGRNVAMYRTTVDTVASGPFQGPLVVSMRPLRADDIALATRLTEPMAQAHGAPIHVGTPAAIGIDDIRVPDFGDPIQILPEELPVFWACGVTALLAVAAARLPLCITHAPGSMLLTDVLVDTGLVESAFPHHKP